MKYIHATVLALALLSSVGMAESLAAKKAREVNELADSIMMWQARVIKANAELVMATNDYKASLEKVLALQENDVQAALDRRKALLANSTVSKRELEESERAVSAAQDRVATTKRQMAESDTLIAETIAEAQKPLTRELAIKRAREIIATNKRERRADRRYYIRFIIFGVAVVHVFD